MDVNVWNEEFKLQGIIDNAKSVIWTERYRGNGDFEIYIVENEKNLKLLKEGYYLTRDGCETGMTIDKLGQKEDEENGKMISATGKSFEAILARRIVWEQTILSGTVEDCIRRLIEENVINPKDKERKIENFIFGNKLNLTEKMEMQITGDNLLEAITSICKTYGYGYKVNLKEGKFCFSLFIGENRSYEQTKNKYVVFSEDFDNLLNYGYEFDLSNYKNVCLVAGEGEGKERRTKIVGAARGIKRRELYKDARNVSTKEGEVSESQYDAELEKEGLEALGEHEKKETMVAEVNYNEPYKYNRDYYLGDIVQVINEYGMRETPRVTSVTECEDDNGIIVIPTFSYEEETQ